MSNRFERKIDRFADRHPRVFAGLASLGAGAVTWFLGYRLASLGWHTQTVAGFLIGIAVGTVVLLPFYLRNPPGILGTGAFLLGSVVLLVLAVIPVLGCAGASSCINPVPTTLFPRGVRAFATALFLPCCIGAMIQLASVAMTGRSVRRSST